VPSKASNIELEASRINATLRRGWGVGVGREVGTAAGDGVAVGMAVFVGTGVGGGGAVSVGGGVAVGWGVTVAVGASTVMVAWAAFSTAMWEATSSEVGGVQRCRQRAIDS
jgi:hypothetical protein